MLKKLKLIVTCLAIAIPTLFLNGCYAQSGGCKAPTMDDLLDIAEVSQANRNEFIINKGFTFVKEVQESGDALNPTKKFTKRLYKKCDSVPGDSDFMCEKTLILTWLVDENRIKYTSYNYNAFLSFYNEIRNGNYCKKMQIDVSLDDINRFSTVGDKTDFIEVYCCEHHCYVFLTLNHICHEGKIQRVYEMAIDSHAQ